VSRPKPQQAQSLGDLLLQMPSVGLKGVGFNLEIFEQLIRDHGVRMVLQKPLQCPKRLDIYSPNHDPNCRNCSNGLIYYGDKEFIGVFQGNSYQKQNMIQGNWDFDQCTIIIPTAYGDGSELDVQVADQIRMPDQTVRYFQLVEHSETGRDRLQFEAVKVDKLIDAFDQEYMQGVDFYLDQGDIVWIPDGARPGRDPRTGRGVIYTVNYYTSPVFTVISLPHQLRTTQTIKDGKSVAERFPQLAFCRKDFLPSREADDVGLRDAGEPLNSGDSTYG